MPALAPYASGGLLMLIGLYGVVRSYWEWKGHDEPVRRVALVLMASFALFGVIGGTMAFLISFEDDLWVLVAAVVTLGYLLLAGETLRLLTRLHHPARVDFPRCSLPRAGFVDSRDDAMAVLKAIASYTDAPLMVVSRKPPGEWGIPTKEYLWLTRVPHEKAVSPNSLHVLGSRVANFLARNPGGVVYVEGIDYLLLYSDFRAVAKLLFALRDVAMMGDSHLLVLAEGLGNKTLLAREFERVSPERVLERLMGRALFGAIPKWGSLNASAEGSEEGSGAGKEEAEEAEPLRREETAKKR